MVDINGRFSYHYRGNTNLPAVDEWNMIWFNNPLWSFEVVDLAVVEVSAQTFRNLSSTLMKFTFQRDNDYMNL